MKSVPIPRPSTKLVSTSCARLGASGVSAASICGSAGSMASIEKATVAKMVPISAMNSPRERRWALGGAGVGVSAIAHPRAFRGRRASRISGKMKGWTLRSWGGLGGMSARSRR